MEAASSGVRQASGSQKQRGPQGDCGVPLDINPENDMWSAPGTTCWLPDVVCTMTSLSA